MEKNILNVLISLFILFIVFQIGPVWDIIIGHEFVNESQAARWIYGAISLNTLAILLIGYLVLKKMK